MLDDWVHQRFFFSITQWLCSIKKITSILSNVTYNSLAWWTCRRRWKFSREQRTEIYWIWWAIHNLNDDKQASTLSNYNSNRVIPIHVIFGKTLILLLHLPVKFQIYSSFFSFYLRYSFLGRPNFVNPRLLHFIVVVVISFVISSCPNIRSDRFQSWYYYHNETVYMV